MRGSLLERFEDKYIPEPNSGCWLWIGATTKQGYGTIKAETDKTLLAHRVSWFLFHNETPSLHVCHSCDNPSCVNPDHLWLGTDLDNTRDCIAKGRARKASRPGELNPRSRLTENQVIEILRTKTKGVILAEKFNCSPSTIYMIRRGTNWSYLQCE